MEDKYNKLEEDIRFKDLVKFFKSLRINEIDAKEYSKNFIELGYDDVDSINQDILTNELESMHMKPGHLARLIKSIDSFNDKISSVFILDRSKVKSWIVTDCLNWLKITLARFIKRELLQCEKSFIDNNVNGSRLLSINSVEDLNKIGIKEEYVAEVILAAILVLQSRIKKDSDTSILSKSSIAFNDVPKLAIDHPKKYDFDDLDTPAICLNNYDQTDVIKVDGFKNSEKKNFSTSPVKFFGESESIIIIREIGRGASGTVHLAIYIPTLTALAVKIIEGSTVLRRKQIELELKALYKLRPNKQEALIKKKVIDDDNSNEISDKSCSDDSRDRQLSISSLEQESGQSNYIIKFYDAYSDSSKGAVCIFLEYMSEGSLQDIIDKGKIPSEQDIAIVAYSILKALLDLTKKNIMHRDIKPGNILISQSGAIKVSDFGIMTEFGDSFTAETFTGTLSYMSPERIRGLKYSYSSDIWSLGIVLLTFSTGILPFPQSNGYWDMAESIQSGPNFPRQRNKKSYDLHVSTLENEQKFSNEFYEFIEAMVEIDPINREGANELIRHKFIEKYIDIKIIDSESSQPCISKDLLDLKEKVSTSELNQILESSIERQKEHIYSSDVQPVEKATLTNLAEQLCINPEKLVQLYNNKNEEMEKEYRSYSDRFDLYESENSNSEGELDERISDIRFENDFQPKKLQVNINTQENQLLEKPDEISDIMRNSDESVSVFTSNSDEFTNEYEDTWENMDSISDSEKYLNEKRDSSSTIDQNEVNSHHNEEDMNKGSNNEYLLINDDSVFTCLSNDQNFHEEEKNEKKIMTEEPPNCNLIDTKKIYINNLESTLPSSPFCSNLNKTLKEFKAIKCTDKSNESAYWTAVDKKNNEIYSPPSNMAPQLVFKTLSTPKIQPRNEMSFSTLDNNNNLIDGGNCSSITRPRHCNYPSNHASKEDYMEPVVDLGMVMVKRSANNSYASEDNHLSTNSSNNNHDSGFPLLITLSDASHSGYTDADEYLPFPFKKDESKNDLDLKNLHNSIDATDIKEGIEKKKESTPILNSLQSLPSFGIILKDFQENGKSDTIDWLPGKSVPSGLLLTVDQEPIELEELHDEDGMDGIYF